MMEERRYNDEGKGGGKEYNPWRNTSLQSIIKPPFLHHYKWIIGGIMMEERRYNDGGKEVQSWRKGGKEVQYGGKEVQRWRKGGIMT